jgi:hypothetical protein
MFSGRLSLSITRYSLLYKSKSLTFTFITESLKSMSYFASVIKLSLVRLSIQISRKSLRSSNGKFLLLFIIAETNLHVNAKC